MRWRPAGAASSPSAMSAQRRSSGSPQRSARALQWSRHCMPAWLGWAESLLRCPTAWRQLDPLELKTRRDGAADQRPVAETLRRLPGVSRHNRLRALPGSKIAAERHTRDAAFALRDFERKRRAGMPMPNFHRVDTMPVRTLAARQQKVDYSGCGAATLDLAGIPKRLAKMSAFRMRLGVQQPGCVGPRPGFGA